MIFITLFDGLFSFHLSKTQVAFYMSRVQVTELQLSKVWFYWTTGDKNEVDQSCFNRLF